MVSSSDINITFTQRRVLRSINEGSVGLSVSKRKNYPAKLVWRLATCFSKTDYSLVLLFSLPFNVIPLSNIQFNGLLCVINGIANEYHLPFVFFCAATSLWWMFWLKQVTLKGKLTALWFCLANCESTVNKCAVRAVHIWIYLVMYYTSNSDGLSAHLGGGLGLAVLDRRLMMPPLGDLAFPANPPRFCERLHRALCESLLLFMSRPVIRRTHIPLPVTTAKFWFNYFTILCVRRRVIFCPVVGLRLLSLEMSQIAPPSRSSLILRKSFFSFSPSLYHAARSVPVALRVACLTLSVNCSCSDFRFLICCCCRTWKSHHKNRCPIRNN